MARVYSLLVSAAFVVLALLSPDADSTLVLAATARTSTTSTATSAATSKTKAQRATGARQNVFVTLKSGTGNVMSGLKSQAFTSRSAKVSAMRDGLISNAQTSQRAVFDALNTAGGASKDGAFTKSESLWVTNQVYVQGATKALITQLSALPDVQSVTDEKIFPLTYPVMTTAAVAATMATTTAQWGVTRINAPAVWDKGYTGTNVVVGVIDTGALYTHTAISGSYRGNSYGWFDPEGKSLTPYDVNGHGTHVVGTIAGANGMGVAPDAKWIMCKGCRADGCWASDLLMCFQFMLCPTLPDGTKPDCTKLAKIVNNSWGGGQGDATFNDVMLKWRAAGIIPVVAAGNTGSTCGTITTPGDYPNVISVGATDVNDKLASFSSKGPTVGGLLKPDISAPGSLVLSSCYTSTTAVCFKSGTSMAAPHVSGAIALLLSAKPGLSFDAILKLIQTRAITASLSKATGYTCAGTADAVFPNNQYGYGRIDILNMLA